MKKWVSPRVAGNVLLVSLSALAVLHVLVLLGVVPGNMVMGGQAAGQADKLLGLEIVALAVTIGFIWIVATKLGYLNPGRYRKVVGYGVWLIFAYLLLNTLWNLMSVNSLEKFVFAPITVVLALCALRLAVEKQAV